ncbi:MFS transporter [Baekduia sp. Peel2402]|uniref:MFS transporter n=1 Tax=Baekduia sp. Peel2402 TaxID=3458296 RepID=UPI00403EB03E
MSVNAEISRRPWNVLALLVVAQFMVVLDITIVNVALPSIGRALTFSAGGLPWVVTAYVLSAGGLYLVGGRLADLVGRRTTFLMGLATFTGGSLVCGLAGSPGLLIGARAVQGAGAALLTPSALSILAVTYGGAQRAQALAIWGAVGSAGAGAGVVAGGMLTTWLSWEWVFWVNVPVGAAVAVMALRVVEAGSSSAARSAGRSAWRALDLPGTATSVTGLVALVYGISEKELLVAAVGALLLVAFFAIERRVARPLVAPSVWRIPALAPGALAMLAATGLIAGTFFLGSVQLQQQLGFSALQTGLAFLPLVVAIAAGVHVASHAIGQVGSRALMGAGFALVAVGAVIGSGGSYASAILPGMVLLGLGFGLTFPSISIAAMSAVGHGEAGSASGLMSTAHEVGAALGVAVLSSVAGASFAFGDAMLAMAVTAGVLAAVALMAAPVVRPAEGTRVAAH